MNKTEIDVTISKILNYKLMIVWGGWKNVDCSDDTLNKSKIKMLLLWPLKFNVTGECVSGLSGEGLDDCYPK